MCICQIRQPKRQPNKLYVIISSLLPNYYKLYIVRLHHLKHTESLTGSLIHGSFWTKRKTKQTKEFFVFVLAFLRVYLWVSTLWLALIKQKCLLLAARWANCCVHAARCWHLIKLFRLLNRTPQFTFPLKVKSFWKLLLPRWLESSQRQKKYNKNAFGLRPNERFRFNMRFQRL